MYKLKFTKTSERIHQGVITKIYKNKGDNVKKGDSLFLIKTNKITLNITSPLTGKITEILAKVGNTINIDDVICHINEDAASVVGDIKVSNKIQKINFKTLNLSSNEKRIRSTPLARKLAAKNEININNVPGSGINGKILIKDIEKFHLQSSSTQNIDTKIQIPSSTSEDQRIPISGMRKAIAKAMKNSWNNVAYTNLSSEVNMTKLWNQRKNINLSLERTHKMKVTFTSFIAKAIILALKEFPMFNAKVDEANNEIIQFGKINLGIAVDTPKGLVVPVIKNTNHMSIAQIAQEISILGKKARESKLTTADLSGGTFTLSNYGSVGSMFGIPVINYPEIGLLGVGVISDRVFGNEKGEFYNGKIMYLTTAADHRWVDGGDIGRFTSRIKELLEEPTLMGVI